MAVDLTQGIEAAALTPAKVEGDAGAITNRPIDELIKADKYLKGQVAAKNPLRGMRLSQIIPPGSI